MTSQNKVITIILLALFTGVMYWFLSQGKTDLELEITSFQGEITVNGSQLDKDTRKINAHQAVIEVAEKGIFNGKLADGSFIQLTENSKITIEHAQRTRDFLRVVTRFILSHGQVSRDIPTNNNIKNYTSRLVTIQATIGIRGTQYAVIADQRSTRAMVYQDSVTIDNDKTNSLALNEGFGARTKTGEPGETPVKLLPPPTRLTPTTNIRITSQAWDAQWEVVDFSENYLVEVATDKTFRNLVYRAHSSNNSFTISALPYDASFYWRVSSIDGIGLRGRGSLPARIQYKYFHEQIRSLKKDSKDSSTLIQKALKGYTEDPQLLKDIGKFYFRIGNYQEAITYYDKAIDLDQDDSELLLERGRALRAIGRHEEAQQDFNKTLSITSNSAEAYWSLGNIEADAERLEDSIEYYYRAIAADPNHREANLSVAKIWMKRGRTDKAYRHLQLHLESRGNDVIAQQMLEQWRKQLEIHDQGKTSK